MMYMKMRRGHCRDDSVMNKLEKRKDMNLPAKARTHVRSLSQI